MNADCLEQPGESQRLCDLMNAPMIGVDADGIARAISSRETGRAFGNRHRKNGWTDSFPLQIPLQMRLPESNCGCKPIAQLTTNYCDGIRL
jgi:hypothetical protein